MIDNPIDIENIEFLAKVGGCVTVVVAIDLSISHAIPRTETAKQYGTKL